MFAAFGSGNAIFTLGKPFINNPVTIFLLWQRVCSYKSMSIRLIDIMAKSGEGGAVPISRRLAKWEN
jgi:hypothetical protein